MNDKYSTTEGKTSEKLSDEATLSAQWKSIDWHKAEREVNRLQIRIVKATQQKDYNAVKRLQYLLTHSFYAKALAVKRVVTNDGRRTPGVDGVLWNTPAKKMAAALSLTDKRYRARPLRRVYIEKKDKKKKRPLGIPTMYDRAMQALYALALEPVAETTADGKSFGFRKGRCAQDACEYLFNALSRKHISTKWVLKGGIYLSARTLSYRGRNSARWYYLPHSGEHDAGWYREEAGRTLSHKRARQGRFKI